MCLKLFEKFEKYFADSVGPKHPGPGAQRFPLGKIYAITERGRTCNEKYGTIPLSNYADCKRAGIGVQHLAPGLNKWRHRNPDGYRAECYFKSGDTSVYWDDDPLDEYCKTCRSICKRGGRGLCIYCL